MAALLTLMRRRLDGLSGKRIVRALVQGGAAVSAMIAFIFLWRAAAGKLAPLLYLAGGIGGAVFVYAGGCLAAKVEESALIRRALRRFFVR